MAAPIRPKDLASGTPTAGADYVFDSGTQVLKTKAIDIVNAATPLASQADAETGTDNVKRVTSLRIAQAIDVRGYVPLADLTASTPTNGVGLVGYDSSQVYDVGTAGYELNRQYEAPALDFNWFPGAVTGKAQIYSDVTFAADGTKPLFGFVHDWTTSVGAGTIPYQVGRAENVTGNVGSSNLYTWNPGMYVNAGWNGDIAKTIEANFANLSGTNIGDGLNDFDVANLAGRKATILSLIGVGQRITAAFYIGAPTAAGQCYNRNIALGDSAKIAQIQCGISGAANIIRASGSTSGALFDVSAVTAGTVLFMPNNGAVSSLNAAGNAIAELMKLNAGNTMILGAGASGGIATANDLVPTSDNIRNIGLSNFRYANIWAQNIHLTPPASNTPTVNGEMVFELTSNTSLAIRVKGSDGVVRSAVLALS